MLVSSLAYRGKLVEKKQFSVWGVMLEERLQSFYDSVCEYAARIGGGVQVRQL